MDRRSLTSIGIPPDDGDAVHLTTAQMRATVTALAAVKSRQDVDAALDIYHPDCVLETPPIRSRLVGAEQLRTGLRRFFRLAPDYAVDLPDMARSQDTLCTWGEISMTLTRTYGGERPNGQRVRTPAFILFRFTDGRIAWERFHYDLADVARQSGVSPDSLLVP